MFLASLAKIDSDNDLTPLGDLLTTRQYVVTCHKMDKDSTIWSFLDLLREKYRHSPPASKCFDEVITTLLILDVLPQKPLDFSVPQDQVVTLHISNLPLETTKEDVEKLFSEYGRVINTTIVKKAKSSFGFVTFENNEVLVSVYKDRENFKINGQHVDIHKAKQNTKTL